jgi:hypothetical protein
MDPVPPGFATSRIRATQARRRPHAQMVLPRPAYGLVVAHRSMGEISTIEFSRSDVVPLAAQPRVTSANLARPTIRASSRVPPSLATVLRLHSKHTLPGGEKRILR